MPIFIVISRHSPESCPIINEKERKFNQEAFVKTGGLAKKHRIKGLGSYVVMPEHAVYEIVEAPSAEAFMHFMSEPYMMQFLAHSVTEIKAAMPLEETMKMLQKVK